MGGKEAERRQVVLVADSDVALCCELAVLGPTRAWVAGNIRDCESGRTRDLVGSEIGGLQTRHRSG